MEAKYVQNCRKLSNRSRARAGFSLVEILIATGMIATLGAMALVLINQNVKRAKQIRAMIYTKLETQRQLPSELGLEYPKITAAPKMKCLHEEEEFTNHIVIHTSCEGPRGKIRYFNTVPRLKTHWGQP